MARQKVVTLTADKTVSLGKGKNKKGVPFVPYVEGYYLGSKQVPSQKSKTGFQSVHYLSTPAGNLGVWGFYNLNEALAVVPKGQMVYIKYLNKTDLPNGNTMHNIDMETDPDLTIATIPTLAFDAGSQEPDEAEGAGADEGASEGQDVDPTEPDEPEDQAPDETPAVPPKAKGTAATPDQLKAQQDKARAMLNKGRPVQKTA